MHANLVFVPLLLSESEEAGDNPNITCLDEMCVHVFVLTCIWGWPLSFKGIFHTYGLFALVQSADELADSVGQVWLHAGKMSEKPKTVPSLMQWDF